MLVAAGDEENGNADKAEDGGDGQHGAHALLAKDEHLENQGEDGQGGGEDRNDAGGHVLLCPEERTIFGDEHEERHDGEASPLFQRGRGFAFCAHEGVKQNAGGEEAGSGGEERGELFDGDADGEERGAPEDIDGEEGEEQANPVGLPSFFVFEIADRFDNH